MKADHDREPSTVRLALKAFAKGGAVLGISLLGICVLGVIIFAAGLAAHFLG